MKYKRILLISIDALNRKDSQPFEKYFNEIYTNFRSTFSWTLPSHIAMLTGLVFPSLQKMKIENILDAKDFLLGIPTIARQLKKAGFKTRAIVASGSFLSKYFGWGDDFDLWTETGANSSDWNGEKILPELGEFVFLHTLYIHNWWEENKPLSKVLTDLQKRKELKNSKNSKYRDIIKDHGKELYQRRIDELLVRLSWLNDVPKDTLVILTSDHGELFFEDGKSFMHGNFSTESEKVFEIPLLIRNNKKRTITNRGLIYNFSLPKIIFEHLGLKYEDRYNQLSPEPRIDSLKKELQKIKGSKSYKLMQFYWSLKSKLLNFKIFKLISLFFSRMVTKVMVHVLELIFHKQVEEVSDSQLPRDIS